jgi:hypothetical protein
MQPLMAVAPLNMPSMQLLSLIFLFGYFLSIGEKFEMVAWQPSKEARHKFCQWLG